MAVRKSTGLKNALAGNASGVDGSLRDLFAYGVIAFFAGTQPASADDTEGSSPLGYLTVASGTFTPGSQANGLLWDDAVNGVCPKPVGTEWSMMPSTAGTAGWLRLYANDRTTGASTTAIRLDASCGVGTGDVDLTTDVLEVGVKFTVESLNLSAA